MIRTQVYLTQAQYDTIYRIAEVENRPAAEIIREFVDQGLAKQKKIRAKDAFMELVNIGKKHHISGPTDLSKNLDSYLYDE